LGVRLQSDTVVVPGMSVRGVGLKSDTGAQAQKASHGAASDGSGSPSRTRPSSIRKRSTWSRSSRRPWRSPEARYSAAARSSLESTSTSCEEELPPVSFGSRARKRKIASRPRWTPAMVPSPGTIHTASGAKRSRRAKPCFCANAPKIRRTTSSFAARWLATATASLPLVDQPPDVIPLRGGEVEDREQAPRLGRVVVRDRGLEMLALRRRLAQLPAQPAEKAHRRLVGHRGLRYSGGHVPRDREPPRRAPVRARDALRRRRRAHPRRRPARGLGVEPPAVGVRRTRHPRARRA